ncbi:MAG: hypothetical protein P8X98_14150, partial [Woeseiaceae bacterium]
TDDIDFVARVEAAEVVNRLEAAGFSCEVLKGNILDGDIAWRQHELGHTPGPNWPWFLDFAAARFDHKSE